ncbi:MAG: MBL fold metallo-hydrolase [Elusimicrobiota bacterium]
MYVRQLELGPMANFVYLIGDPETKECAVVDPAWNVPALLEAARADGYRITKVLLTHGHSDHINGVEAVLREHAVPVHVHEADAFALRHVGEGLRKSADGEKVRLGEMEIACIHTPGHTEGSQCLLVRGHLLTGDTLFIGGCGRVDLAGSDPEKMYHSLRRLAALEDAVRVLPGHDYSAEKSALLGAERERNPYIRASLRASADEFRRLVGP